MNSRLAGLSYLVMMPLEIFDPGRWLRAQPLIYPMMYEILLLTFLFLVAHVLEKTIEGMLRGKTITDSLPGIGGGGLRGCGASPSSCLSRRSRFRDSGI